MSTISFLSRRAKKGDHAGDETALPPDPELERALASLHEAWKKVLRVDSVAHDDNLFELGGTSLHAMLLASHVERLPATLDLVGFLERPTFDGLCANITMP
jgi:aryl carrier-like protein